MCLLEEAPFCVVIGYEASARRYRGSMRMDLIYGHMILLFALKDGFGPQAIVLRLAHYLPTQEYIVFLIWAIALGIWMASHLSPVSHMAHPLLQLVQKARKAPWKT